MAEKKTTTTKKKSLYHTDEQLGLVKTCVEANLPVLLIGETGTGKTTLVQELANERGQKFIRINLNGQTAREDLIGKYQLVEGNTVWQDGLLLTALKKGYWILLDEINAALPEVILVLQALLELREGNLGKVVLVEKDGEEVPPHANTRIFATCNPVNYVGLKDINQATLSRFVITEVPHLSKEVEMELVASRFKIAPENIAKLAEIGFRCRQKKQTGEASVFISTRDLEQAALLHQCGLNIDLAVESAIVQKAMESGEKNLLRGICSSVLGIDNEKMKKIFTHASRMEKVMKEQKKIAKKFSTLNSEFKDMYKELSDASSLTEND